MKKGKKKLKISILGSQASGKGTQAFILSITQGVPSISIGNLLRDVSKEDSDRGREVAGHLAKGTFPAETIVLPILKDWMDKHPDGWIIDGFPRTVSQADLSAEFFKPDVVIFLELPDEEAKRRISYRRVCSKCKTNYNIITQPPKNSKGVCDVCGGELVRRADDTPDLVAERLKTYHELTEPVKAWYGKRKGVTLLEIDGRPGIKEVAHEIEQRVGSLKKKHLSIKRWQAWLIATLFILIAVTAILTWIGSNV